MLAAFRSADPPWPEPRPVVVTEDGKSGPVGRAIPGPDKTLLSTNLTEAERGMLMETFAETDMLARMTSPQDAGRADRLRLVIGGEGMITGTVVCAAVIAYGGNHVDSVAQLTRAILGTVAVYWLAHLHAVTIGSSLTHRHHPIAAFRHSLAETWAIPGASVAPVVVLMATSLLGADLLTAAWTALIATIALLTSYSYMAGMRGGLGTWGRIASAAAGAALGVLVALLKVALH